MKISKCLSYLVFSFVLVVGSGRVFAAEICGNGLDDDANSRTDEGCDPVAVTDVCENPLGCDSAGAVSYRTGNLVWRGTRPDISLDVPYGTDLIFKRTYHSQYEPGYGTWNYKNNLGKYWQHNYMSWISKVGQTSTAVIHLPTGQDVFATLTSSDANWDYYTVQSGWDFKLVQQCKTASCWVVPQYDWWIQRLDGTQMKFDGSTLGTHTAKMNFMGDQMAFGVDIVYDGSGRVSEITSPYGKKYRLLLSYTVDATDNPNGLLRFVTAQSYDSVTLTWTTKVTIKYSYVTSGTLLSAVTDNVTGTSLVAYTYSGNYLSQVKDSLAGSTVNASFGYRTDVAGKVAYQDISGLGVVGYKWGDASCDSGNGLFEYFNKASTTACTSDAGCGTGYCGGMPTVGGTGQCYKARRCVTSTIASGEVLPTTVTASCGSLSADRCLTVKEYQWNTTELRAKGIKSPSEVWTSYIYNTNGLPTTVVENDTDSDATTVPAGARTTFYTYNSSCPALKAEERLLSELKPGGTCSAAVSTDCKRSIYTYTNCKINTDQEIGYTYDSSGTVVAYNFTTDTDYDSFGRVTTVFGPRAAVADDVEYTYYSSANSDDDQRLQSIKKKKSVGVYLTTTNSNYDFWGHARTVNEPERTMCKTFESLRGKLATSTVRVTETNCTGSPDANDETRTFTYDSFGRVTRIQYPKLNCKDYAYDASGRLSTVKELDWNGSACSTGGNRTVYTYDFDHKNTDTDQINYYTGTSMHSSSNTLAEDGRVLGIVNPVNTAKKKLLDYDDDGTISLLKYEDWSSGNAKTVVYGSDNYNQLTSIKQYKDASTFDQWALTPTVTMSKTGKVTDPASLDLTSVYDDLGRQVKTVSNGVTTVSVYHEGGVIITLVKGLGGANQVTDTFTYDALNRVTAWNTGDATCGAGATEEIQYFYDDLTGSSCPVGSTCNNLADRPSYIKTKMWCDAAKADKTYDQYTYFSYDDSGRKVEETVTDDGGRNARMLYAYDKNSNRTSITTPAPQVTTTGYDYDDMYVSNANRITGIRRDGSFVVEAIYHQPFGPISNYTMEATLAGIKADYQAFFNKAYRNTTISYGDISGSNYMLQVQYAEDDRGRYTKKDFSWTAFAQDLWLLFDDLNRIVCRAGVTFVSCPASGFRETFNYNSGQDRSSFFIDNTMVAATFTPIYIASTDRIDYITYGAGPYTLDYSWDGRGNRLWDDSTEWSGASDDKRSYTYDARNNLIGITGKFSTGGTLHNYTILNVYDDQNRRIFKSFKDTTAIPNVEQQYYFYYDLSNNLMQVKHTPDIASPNTFYVYQWYWADNKPVLYYQHNCTGGTCTGATVTRRYLLTDEQNRPQAAWLWPTSGSSTRVWEVTAGSFGWDFVSLGHTIYQPLRFPGQIYDVETTVVTAAGVEKRPGLIDNRFRVYDGMIGQYLQSDPMVTKTWFDYGYAANDPISNTDKNGLHITDIFWEVKWSSTQGCWWSVFDGCVSGPGNPGPLPTVPPRCGDGTCQMKSRGEDCISCFEDCGPCDGPAPGGEESCAVACAKETVFEGIISGDCEEMGGNTCNICLSPYIGRCQTLCPIVCGGGSGVSAACIAEMEFECYGRISWDQSSQL